MDFYFTDLQIYDSMLQQTIKMVNKSGKQGFLTVLGHWDRSWMKKTNLNRNIKYLAKCKLDEEGLEHWKTILYLNENL